MKRPRMSKAQIAAEVDNLRRRRAAAERAARVSRPRERKLWRVGGSVVMALPPDFLDILGWKAGDAVLVSLDGKSIIIE